jgi:hypothetical protein
MRTSLSRNLYRLDEVVAAFRMCIVERRVNEGLFWALELFLSEELELLAMAMLDVWVFTVGARRLRWFFDFMEARNLDALDRDDGRILLVLAERLLRLPRDCADSSMVALSVMCCKDLMRTRGPGVSGGVGAAAGAATTDAVTAFRVCMAARDVRGAASAWKAGDSRAELIREIYAEFPARAEVLAQLSAMTTEQGLGWREGTAGVWWDLAGYMTIWAACLTDADWAASVAPFRDAAPDVRARIDTMMDGWEDLAGTVAGRVYAIPRDCLKWETARGRMYYTQTTVGELWHAWMALKGTRYWDNVAAECGYAWTGYDTAGWDAFVSEAFEASDWPDEWSAECQAKSHGDGCLSQTERPFIMQWLKRWMSAQNSIMTSYEYTAREWMGEQRAAIDAAGAVWFDEVLAVLEKVARGYSMHVAAAAPVAAQVDPAISSLASAFGKVSIGR